MCARLRRRSSPVYLRPASDKNCDRKWLLLCWNNDKKICGELTWNCSQRASHEATDEEEKKNGVFMNTICVAIWQHGEYYWSQCSRGQTYNLCGSYWHEMACLRHIVILPPAADVATVAVSLRPCVHIACNAMTIIATTEAINFHTLLLMQPHSLFILFVFFLLRSLLFKRKIVNFILIKNKKKTKNIITNSDMTYIYIFSLLLPVRGGIWYRIDIVDKMCMYGVCVCVHSYISKSMTIKSRIKAVMA